RRNRSRSGRTPRSRDADHFLGGTGHLPVPLGTGEDVGMKQNLMFPNVTSIPSDRLPDGTVLPELKADVRPRSPLVHNFFFPLCAPAVRSYIPLLKRNGYQANQSAV